MKKIFLIVLTCLLLICAALLPRGAAAADAAAPGIIPTEEVKDGDGDGQEQVSLEEVEQARVLTPEGLYGLGGLWLLILLAVYLIRRQVRDDEKLYDEGYYDREPDKP